jgi:hypothetical protein
LYAYGAQDEWRHSFGRNTSMAIPTGAIRVASLATAHVRPTLARRSS